MPARIKRFCLEAYEIFYVSYISTLTKTMSFLAKHGFPSDLRNSCAPNLFRVKLIWLRFAPLESICEAGKFALPCLCVCVSVCTLTEQLDTQGPDFGTVLCWRLLIKYIHQI